MFKPQYANEPNINLGSQHFQALIDPENNDYPNYSSDEEEQAQKPQPNQEQDNQFDGGPQHPQQPKKMKQSKEQKCEEWCMGMLNHLVGHVVGRQHQFPEKLAMVKLNEKSLVNAQMTRIKLELRQRRKGKP